MSDDPADSLRREQLDKMTEAGTGAILASVFGEDQRASYWWDIVSIALDRGMLPLIEAVVEAARADERERISAKIADERMNISGGDIRHDEWLAGKATGLDEAIALARGGV